jgi:hypothetical protein
MEARASYQQRNSWWLEAEGIWGEAYDGTDHHMHLPRPGGIDWRDSEKKVSIRAMLILCSSRKLAMK